MSNRLAIALGVCVGALIVALAAGPISRYWAQRTIEQAGGNVSLDAAGTPMTVLLSDCNVDDGILQSVRRLETISKLSLSSTRATGRGIDQLHGLKALAIDYAQVDAVGLQAIARNKTLKCLHIAGNRLTDADLRVLADCQLAELTLDETGVVELDWLKGMHRLEMLSLAGTSVGADALASLINLESLDDLNVAATNVTSRDLAELLSKRRLKYLAVDKSMSEADLTALREIQPECEIFHESDAVMAGPTRYASGD